MFDQLAQHLLAHLDVILQRWRAAATRDPDHPANRLHLDGAALDDHLPPLMEMLARCLRGDDPGEVDREGAEHGHQRRENGYRLTELLWEMTLFRRVVMEAIEDFQAEPHRLTPAELSAARLATLDLLDRSVHASASQYTQEAEAERDAARAQLADAATRLRDANARLEEEHVQKDRFIAVLAHELRGPLMPILNALTVLERLPPDDPKAPSLRAIVDRQARHLSRLIDDLLDVNRIAHGKLELRPAVVSLQAAVGFAVEAVQPTFAERDVRLVLDLEPTPLWVFADATRLAQVATNLLLNAAKFTPPAGTVTVMLRPSDGAAVLRVRDTGPGIPPETLPRMFEPFEQGGSPESNGGLGLGLAIARGLVEAHHGTIEAHDAPHGPGAEFVVRLPLAASAP